jgi:hypothetical protein
MVPDPSWDNPAAPPRKKGLSLFGKVAIGCGSALLCFLLAIGATFWLLFSKATQALDRGWASVHAQIQSLRTDEGVRALYRDNPGLAQNYPTEAEFLKAAREWRPKLGDIPEKRPDIRKLLKEHSGGGVVIKSRDSSEGKVMVVNIGMSTGATLVVELRDDKLVDIQVD